MSTFNKEEREPFITWLNEHHFHFGGHHSPWCEDRNDISEWKYNDSLDIHRVCGGCGMADYVSEGEYIAYIKHLLKENS